MQENKKTKEGTKDSLLSAYLNAKILDEKKRLFKIKKQHFL